MPPPTKPEVEDDDSDDDDDDDEEEEEEEDGDHNMIFLSIDVENKAGCVARASLSWPSLLCCQLTEDTQSS